MGSGRTFPGCARGRLLAQAGEDGGEEPLSEGGVGILERGQAAAKTILDGERDATGVDVRRGDEKCGEARVRVAAVRARSASETARPRGRGRAGAWARAVAMCAGSTCQGCGSRSSVRLPPGSRNAVRAGAVRAVMRSAGGGRG